MRRFGPAFSLSREGRRSSRGARASTHRRLLRRVPPSGHRHPPKPTGRVQRRAPLPSVEFLERRIVRQPSVRALRPMRAQRGPPHEAAAKVNVRSRRRLIAVALNEGHRTRRRRSTTQTAPGIGWARKPLNEGHRTRRRRSRRKSDIRFSSRAQRGTTHEGGGEAIAGVKCDSTLMRAQRGPPHEAAAKFIGV